MNFKRNMEIVEEIWSKGGETPLLCPSCKGSLTIVQVEPIEDLENPYIPYRTVIECSSCSFNLETESFSILGSVRDFDLHYLEICSWSPSGSRVVSRYEHFLNFDLLKKLKQSGELVEFLVANKQVVQVIG
jgi:hypothetical protein